MLCSSLEAGMMGSWVEGLGDRVSKDKNGFRKGWRGIVGGECFPGELCRSGVWKSGIEKN